MENMSGIDLGIIGFVLFLSLKGFFNGFFKELFGLIGIIGGIFVGSRFGQEAGLYINDNFLHLENGSVIAVTGFIATLIIFWIGMTIIGNILSSLTNKSGLGAINKLLGLVFAGVKIALILAVIIHSLLSVKVVQESTKEYVENSVVIPQLQEVGAYLVNTDFSTMVSQADEKTEFDLNSTFQTVKNAIPTSDEVSDGIDNMVEKTVNQQLSE